MRLGIDFGTTRVVVAAADRGNFPVVTFESDSGEGCEWYPSVCARRGDEFLSGHAALGMLRDPDWQMCRSLKRALSGASCADEILGLPVHDVLVSFLKQLRDALRHNSNLELGEDEPLEAAIAVPANASANQRLLTIDAFQSAGFEVPRVLDEPSAAGLEYAWRRPADAKVRRRHVAVYDLGGGTFDASVISLGDRLHEVVTTSGIERLGGDDFDEALLKLCLQALQQPEPDSRSDRDRLLEICRFEKERFTTSTRRLKPDLFGDGREVTIKIADFEDVLRPMIQRSLDVLDVALTRASDEIGEDIERNTVVYQVGGASQLPTVSRMLRERFGRRVWRSPYAHASVAVGLAIALADPEAICWQRHAPRHFGVWRESEGGRHAWFDRVLSREPEATGINLPAVIRRYHAVHNVGHFRFVECTRLRDDGSPAGHVLPCAEVRFPLVRGLCGQRLDDIPVLRLHTQPAEIEERYRIDDSGNIEVQLVNLTEGYHQTFAVRPAG